MSNSNINIAGAYVVIEGRVEDRLLDWPDATFDACLCDPPYGLKFMGKSWDHGVPSVEIWREVFRVLKPGAFLMAFGGTRTYHRLTCAIEDAGFEIRDCLMWLYGSGFPKSLDISKEMDKQDKVRAKLRFVRWMQTTGIRAKEIDCKLKSKDLISHTSNFSVHFFNESQPALPTKEYWEVIVGICRERDIHPPEDIELYIDMRLYGSAKFRSREVVGYSRSSLGGTVAAGERDINFIEYHSSLDIAITAPLTCEASMWSGYGTALKPAWEPIILAMKPCEGTFAQNALTYGVAGLNIDGCRVGTQASPTAARRETARRTGNAPVHSRPAREAEAEGKIENRTTPEGYMTERPSEQLGRWPANLLLSHTSWCVEVGTRQVKGSKLDQVIERAKSESSSIGKQTDGHCTGYTDENGLETIPAFDCHPLCPVRLLDEQTNHLHSAGFEQSGGGQTNPQGSMFGIGKETSSQIRHADSGGASRFFYTAKVSTRERNLGGIDCRHPTLKPISLTSYLATLLLPPALPDSPLYSPPHSLRSLLTPFSGAGSEVIGGLIAGWDLCVGIEMEPEYVEWANARIAGAVAGELDKESAAYRSARERRGSTSAVSVSTSVDSSSAPRPRRRRSSSTSAIDAEALNSLGLDAEPEIIESMRVDEVAEVTETAEEVEDDA